MVEWIAAYGLAPSVLIFVIGLIMGSFLNVCICRMPEGESIAHPPSHCPICNRRLRPAELIPIFSWLAQRGRCKGCNTPISIRYPLTELLCGLMYLWIFRVYGLSVETLALLSLMSLLFIALFIDLDHMLIPNDLVTVALALGGLLYLYFLLTQVFGLIEGPAYRFFENAGWYTPLLGMLSASGLLFAVALLSFLVYGGEGGMGMGDVKLYLPIGLFLGWKLALLSLFGAVVAGGAAGVALLACGRKGRRSMIPFGPFIIVSTFFSALYGQRLLLWYLGQLGLGG